MAHYYPLLVFFLYLAFLLLYAHRTGRTFIGDQHRIEVFPPRDALLLGLGLGGIYLYLASVFSGRTFVSLVLPGALILTSVIVLRYHALTRRRNRTSQIGEFYKFLLWIIQRPLRLGNIIASIILISAILFATVGFNDQVSGGDRPEFVSIQTHGFSAFSRALYLSVMTFTTIGYGDVVPAASPWSRLVAGCEGLLGLFCFGVLISVFVSKATGGVGERWLRQWMRKNRL